VAEPAEQALPDHHVQSLARGLSVIRAFGADRPEQTLSDVARVVGLSRSAARRFLLTLVDLGYVRTNGKTFSLTPQVLELGYAYLSSLTLPTIAQPHLEALVSRTHESSSLAVLDGTDIVYVARVQAKRIMAVDIRVGTRFPAYATSMGRVILADLDEGALDEQLGSITFQQFTPRTVQSCEELTVRLDEVRAQGYAVVDQELEQGLRSVAAPVRDPQGRTVAAVNVSSLVTGPEDDRAESLFVPALRECVAAIEADLRHS
jgi:IclR family pca regulon transcriptional regulator